MVEPIGRSGFLFQSDEHINYISSPIVILHSEDDMVVPFKLGLQVTLLFTLHFFMFFKKKIVSSCIKLL